LTSSGRRALCLLGATALGAGLLAPAADAGRKGSCQIAVEVASTRVTAGQTATLSGSLSCPSSAETGEQTITIFEHTAGTPGFDEVATATPEAGGDFHYTTEALQTNSVFYARVQGGARSRPMPVTVAPLVTISGPQAGTQLSIGGQRSAASARSSNTVTFTGTVDPDEAGATVVLQREGVNIEENWQRIATGEVGTEGKYAITHTFGVAGTANVRVVVHPHGLLPGASETVSLQVMRHQNPRLTIQASAAPLTDGQALTLSGTAAGSGPQALTLLARTRGGAFAPLVTTSTEGDGSYVFASLSPAADTWYEVTGTHARSTILFEGVRPKLSAHVSSPSVSSGDPVVTFTGTVEPARAGVVNLERQDADGLGFQMVQAATVAPDGSFSIEHAVSGAGTQAFRIVLGVGDGMQAASSGLLDVQVTRAPGAPLEPEAPAAPLGEG
jgi:hypothetical protein